MEAGAPARAFFLSVWFIYAYLSGLSTDDGRNSVLLI